MALLNALARYAVCSFLPLFLSSLQADDLAPPHEYEGRTIEQLRFEPELQPVSRADLARLVPFKPGMPLRLAEVRDAIKRMYGTGEYADIEISTEPSASGVVLLIRTREQWFLGPVEPRGKNNRPPHAGQWTNDARLQQHTPIEDQNLQTATNITPHQ